MFKRLTEVHNGFNPDGGDKSATKDEKTTFFQTVIKFYDKKKKSEIFIYSEEIYRSAAQAQMHGFEMVEDKGLEQNKNIKNIQIGVLGLVLNEMAYDD